MKQYNTDINHSRQFKFKNPQTLTYDPISLFFIRKKMVPPPAAACVAD